jgi:hypothetical protein
VQWRPILSGAVNVPSSMLKTTITPPSPCTAGSAPGKSER